MGLQGVNNNNKTKPNHKYTQRTFPELRILMGEVSLFLFREVLRSLCWVSGPGQYFDHVMASAGLRSGGRLRSGVSRGGDCSKMFILSSLPLDQELKIGVSIPP